MKAKKLSKVILSFVLSVALLTEPLTGMTVVRAEETQTAGQLTGGDSNSDDITTDNQVDGDENNKQDDSGANNGLDSDKEKEDGSQEDPDDLSEGERDDETSEPAEEEPGEVTDEDDPAEEAESPEEPEGLEEDVDKDKEDSDGFSGMPSSYKLTSFQKELKSDLGNILGKFSESGEGEAYAEREVFTFAGSQKEAEMIAEAYNAEIKDFDSGVLTLKLRQGVTVKSALLEASELDNNLPAVWPNYRRELYGEAAPESEENVIPGLEVEEEEYSIENGTLEAYGQALNELSGYGDEYLQPTSDYYQWFHTAIGSIYAWDAGYKGEGIKVGVIDSGIDANSDLQANVFGSQNFCKDQKETTDNTGVNNGTHGTHVAGIIAALQNDVQGVGVAPKAKIYNAKVFGPYADSGYDATIAKAIMYLINEDGDYFDNKEPNYDNAPLVDIINMSLGGPAENPGMELLLERAYKKGVIVFAATGNDGGSLMQYPASYQHVIGVAATDVNNERAVFSNYGSSTDLAAPGVNIWSTNGSTYDLKQGTSMACPVAAGEAAVILSGKDALPTLAGKTGKARVDALESIMMGNTISAGSGMGRGITSLTKVFKLSTAATKPNAPTISAVDTSNQNQAGQSMNIIIEAQAGMKICYTTNGKNPVFKNGEVEDGTTLVEPQQPNKVTIPVDGKNAAQGTVKAMAVNASGVISAVKSYKYTLKPYVTGIAISGPVRVEKGKTIQLIATVTPTYATKKDVTWTLQTADGKAVDETQIKIDSKKGKITTTVNAVAGTKYTVTVTALDNPTDPAKATCSVEIVDVNTAIQKIAIDKLAKKELWIPSATTVSLAEYVTAEEKGTDGKNQSVDKEKLAKQLVWTSSKPTVATVDSDGKVTAKTVGTTTITVKADDNLGKKATVNITVKQAVTGIAITTDQGKKDARYFSVAAGKGMALKAEVTPAKPTNNKIIWTISPASDNPATPEDMKNITINKSSGKITVKATAKEGVYTVTAEAADEQGAKTTKNVTVVKGVIGSIAVDKNATLYTTSEGGDTSTTITATIAGVKGAESDFDQNAYMVTSSNESVVTVEKEESPAKGTVKITLKATGKMYGKSNIVVASTDGSNKKATCAVTVNGGINKVELQDSSKKKVSKLTLFRKGTATTAPSTAELYASIGGSQGANLQAYEVTSNNPLVKVKEGYKASGKIELEASSIATGNAIITLASTDGSKKKATCTVTVVNPASKITIASKGGAGQYVAWGKSLQLTATVETEYGAVANKNVTWSVPETIGTTPTKNILAVNASGKVTVKNQVGYGRIPVTATAKDGSGLAATYYVYVVPPTTTIAYYGKQYDNGVSTVYFISDCMASMTVISSSPRVASPTISYSPAYIDKSGNFVMGYGYIQYIPNRVGSTTFTIKALDATNKSYQYKISVK